VGILVLSAAVLVNDTVTNLVSLLVLVFFKLYSKLALTTINLGYVLYVAEKRES
jgi:hypothetical protein